MRSQLLWRTKNGKILISLWLVLLLVGCGETSTTSYQITPKATNAKLGDSSTPQVISKMNLSTLPLLKRGSVTLNVSNFEIHCPDQNANHPNDNIVLKRGGKALYGTGDIQQITAYLSSLNSTPLPNTELQLQPGGPTGNNDVFNNTTPGCVGILEVTNIGQTAIQLMGIAMQFIGVASRNTASYALIDVCPIRHEEAISCNYAIGGQTGPTSAFFRLYNASTGTLLTDQITYLDMSMNEHTGTLVLGPKEVIVLQIAFESQENLAYTLEPEVIVNTVNGAGRLPLPNLTRKIFFANPNQFSCYRLEVNGFVQIFPGVNDPMRCI